MPNELPLVSTFLLNWNGAESSCECLESLAAVPYARLEIIVVDNGSSEADRRLLRAGIEKVKAAGCDVRLVELSKNTGFTGGNIAALAEARGEFVFLVNNDCVVDPRIVEYALQVFESDPRIAVVGGRAFLWDSANASYDQSNAFHSFQIIHPITADTLTLEAGDKLRDVNNVSGAAMFVRRSVIARVGFLDDRFFAYYEETDLCARMKRAGYRVVYCPELMIWHKGGASTKNRRELFYYLYYRNQFLFAARNFDAEFFKAFRKAYRTAAFRAVLDLTYSKNKSVNRAKVRAWAWNMRNLATTLQHRRLLQNQYDAGYSEQLIRENPAPVSAIVDADGDASQLTMTLVSLFAQTIVPNEIVVVVREGNHDTVTLLEQNFPSVVIVEKQHYVDALNWSLGLACARERWLIFTSTGDIVPPTFVEASLRVAWLRRRSLILGTGARKLARTFQFRSVMSEIGNSFLVRRDLVALSAVRQKSKADFLQRLLVDCLDQGVSFNSVPLSIESQKLPTGTGPSFPNTFGYQRAVARKVMRNTTSRVRRSTLGKGMGLKCSDSAPSDEGTAMPDAIFKSDDVVVFINCRDRLESLLHLIAWLERANLRRIVLIDNDSTYPPLVEYLATTRYQVLRLRSNVGHKAPWVSLAIAGIAGGAWFIVTDPDVIPDPDCPLDVVQKMHALLIKYPGVCKVGMSLAIDDLPEHYHLKDAVISWESRYWEDEVEPDVFRADVDTTFALYRPNTGYMVKPALRIAGAYVARHTPWYADSSNLSDEELFYRRRLNPAINTWNQVGVNEHHQKPVKSSVVE
ncbi:MAG TPA: glycosyltransferase family 2 protein [Kofleriaceae bacterium]|nr:glycosyltransferase family 2 protein [Kofleriaceae bacterium]